MKKGTVYITNEAIRKGEDGVQRPAFDLTPAMEYGNLEVLIPAGMSLLSTVPMVRMLRDKLAEFSDDDYLLPVGDPAAMAAAAMIAAEANGGRVKILRWDRREYRYVALQLDTSGRAI